MKSLNIQSSDTFVSMVRQLTLRLAVTICLHSSILFLSYLFMYKSILNGLIAFRETNEQKKILF